MEEHIVEEPHSIFISVPGTAFIQELHDDFLNDHVEDESPLPCTVTVTKEEPIRSEPDPLTPSTNIEASPEKSQCIIKEEIFIDQDEQCENKNILLPTETGVNEQTTACKETHYEDHHESESESSSSLLRFLLLTHRDQTDNIKKTEYVCEVCNKAFEWCSSFYQHKLMNHCQTNNQDDMCNDNSKAVDTADIEVSLEHGSSTVPEVRPITQVNVKRRLACDVCNKEFRWHSSLRRHKLTHYRHLNDQHDVCNGNTTDQKKVKKRFVCDICNKVIRSQRAFCRHKIMHHRQMNNQNDAGNDNTQSAVTTETGILTQESSSTVSENRSSVCAFIQSGTLSKEKLVNSGVEGYKCKVCDETFSDCNLLTTHKLVCSDITHCNECEESFANDSDLLEHDVG